MQLVLGRKKLVIPKAKASMVEVPYWADIAIRKVWPIFCNRPRFRAYIPDEWLASNGKKICRDYFWVVVLFLYPQWVDQTITRIRKVRHDR